ncbi:MAG TPA: hypothetical protein VMG12_06730 [Polyangiaceae bacterium]|nr:hypothetical protein [Polyangiaceae bacterium]
MALCTACGGDEAAPVEGAIVLADDQNYELQSSLSIANVETASGADLDICWSDLVSDLQCHPVQPMPDLDNLALLRFLHLSHDAVEARLTSGQLTMSEVDGYLEYRTDHASTCSKLSSMSFFGTPIDIQEQYRESSEHSYMLLLAEGTTPGVGARGMIFVTPTSSSSNTRVDVPSGCGLLDVSADLSSATPLNIPTTGPWTIDWRNLTRDGQGNPIVFESIDSVLLGFYAGMTVADLESDILDLELNATALWELPLTGGRTAELGRARQRDTDAPFAGFSRPEPGVWVMGLMCSTCQNPAPVVLSVLQPSGAQ